MYPPPRIENFFKHKCYRFLSILVMGDLHPPSVPTYISSLSKTVKRKPLIFNFKWNFGWILGQHDILVLDDVPPPPRIRKKCFYLKLDLSWPMYPPPPPPWNQKSQPKCKKMPPKSLSHRKYEMLIFGLRSTSDDQPSNLSR